MRVVVKLMSVVSLVGMAMSAVAADAPADLSLTRFDCGKTTTLADVSRFSDVAAFKGLNIQLTFSCYLVKHGNDYFVWDTGNPMATGATPAPTAPNDTTPEWSVIKLDSGPGWSREVLRHRSGREGGNGSTPGTAT